MKVTDLKCPFCDNFLETFYYQQEGSSDWYYEAGCYACKWQTYSRVPDEGEELYAAASDLLEIFSGKTSKTVADNIKEELKKLSQVLLVRKLSEFRLEVIFPIESRYTRREWQLSAVNRILKNFKQEYTLSEREEWLRESNPIKVRVISLRLIK